MLFCQKDPLNLGFQIFRPIFLKIVLFVLMFALLTFRDKGQIVIEGTFQRSKILWYAQNF